MTKLPPAFKISGLVERGLLEPSREVGFERDKSLKLEVLLNWTRTGRSDGDDEDAEAWAVAATTEKRRVSIIRWVGE